MKPLRLEITAFGPFRAREVIDFTALGTRSFFLLCGQTGSGKTTILDALCFALYGKSTGGERRPEQMRNDLADDAVDSEVVLDFELAARRYRIRRTTTFKPEHRKTDKAGRVEFFDRTGAGADEDGALLGNKKTEVDDLVSGLIGFHADEFCQVVILPQGKFRDLLTADSKEREKVLQTIFQAQHYTRLQDALKEEQQRLKNEVAQNQFRADALLNQLDVDSAESLAEKARHAEERLGALGPELAAAQKAEESARARLARDEQAAAKLAEAAAAKAALAAVEARREAIDQTRRDLKRARSAAELAPLLESLKQRRDEATKAEADRAAAETRLRAAREDDSAAQRSFADETSRTPERDAARAEAADAKRHAARAAELGELQRAVADATKAAKQASASHDKCRAAVAANDAATQEHRARATSLAAEAEGGEAAGERLVLLKKQAAERVALDSDEAALAKAAKAARAAELARATAEADREQAQARLDALLAARDSEQAAILAESLEEGAPCPVCGSTEHPKPAVPGATPPTPAEIVQAREELASCVQKAEACRKSAEAANSAETKLQAQVTTRRGSLGAIAEAPSESLQQRVRELEEKRKAIEAANAALAKARAELAELEGACAEIGKAAEKAAEEASAAREALAKATGALSERQADIPEKYRDPATAQKLAAAAAARVQELDAALEKARQQAEAAASAAKVAESSLAAARQHADDCVAKRDYQLQVFLRTAEEHGFGSEMDVAQACALTAQAPRLEAAIREFDAALSSAGERLRIADDAARGVQPPDLDATRAACAVAEQARSALLAEQGRLTGEGKRLAKAVKDHQRLAEQLAADRRQLEEVIAPIARAASGDPPNRYRVNLQRFVLAAMFEEVLHEASRRLALMSEGRYELNLFGGVKKGGGASGLELEVLDSWTGKSRPVATLSGGESFLAALSLALGLADVVQRHAGGVRLDTIFIDEGFGSLDEEALRRCMDALRQLQQGGRLVGVISHVEEMKREIDVRLEVSAGRQGSSARFVM